MTKSTAIALLIGKSIFGATMALGLLTSPAGNAEPRTVSTAMDRTAFTIDAPADACAHHSSHVRRACAGAIKGICVR